MSGKLALVLLALCLAVTAARGQDAESARLRLMQLSYVSEGSAAADIQVDDTVVFEGIGFPFTTDYVELAAGSHTLTTFNTDEPAFSASTLLTLESGHSYSVVADGDYREGVNFIVVDEGVTPAEENPGSTALVVNLSGQPITDIAVDGEAVLDAIAVDSYGTIRLPETEFVMSGRLGDRDYSETFNPHSNTLFLIAVRQMPSGDPQIIYQRSSPLTIAGYLQSVGEGAQFSQAAGLFAATGLLDSMSDGAEYTLFLPTDTALGGFSPLADAGELRALLSNAIVPQGLPPYMLPSYDTLTTLAGAVVSLNFGATDSGYWEIEGAPILWDLRLADGVIYAIDGVVGPD